MISGLPMRSEKAWINSQSPLFKDLEAHLMPVLTVFTLLRREVLLCPLAVTWNLLYTVLNQDRHGLTLWAPVCSSWGLSIGAWRCNSCCLLGAAEGASIWVDHFELHCVLTLWLAKLIRRTPCLLEAAASTTSSGAAPDLASNAEDLLKRGQGEGVSLFKPQSANQCQRTFWTIPSVISCHLKRLRLQHVRKASTRTKTLTLNDLLRSWVEDLGKGHDAAVVGAWLNEELRQIDVAWKNSDQGEDEGCDVLLHQSERLSSVAQPCRIITVATGIILRTWIDSPRRLC